MRYDLVQVRRATAAEWTAANPVLASGELGFVTDTNALKIGDGSTAFDSLSAIGGGGATVLTAVKTANETKTLDTTFADDADLVIPMAANKLYELRVFILQNSDAATDFKWRINGPTGALAKFSGSAGTSIGFSGFGTTNSVNGAGADRIGIYNGQVTTDSTAGDLQFQWAQLTSGAGTTTLKQGSYIRLLEIA